MSPFSGWATCYLTQRNIVKSVKQLFGEEHVKAVLQRLDRLTPNEARLAASQTLEVVRGLLQGMKVVMEGEQTHSACNLPSVESSHLGGNASADGIRESIGTPCYRHRASAVSNYALETLHHVVSDMNRSNR